MSFIVTIRVRPPLVLRPEPQDKRQETITVQPTPSCPALTSSEDTVETDEDGEFCEPSRQGKDIESGALIQSLSPEDVRCVKRICHSWGVRDLLDFFSLPEGDPRYQEIDRDEFIPKKVTHNFVWRLRHIASHCDRDEARARIVSAVLSHGSHSRAVRLVVLSRVIKSLKTDKHTKLRTIERFPQKEKPEKQRILETQAQKSINSLAARSPEPAHTSTSLEPETSQFICLSDSSDEEKASTSPTQSFTSSDSLPATNPNMNQSPQLLWGPAGPYYPATPSDGDSAGSSSAVGANMRPPMRPAPSALRFSSTPDDPMNGVNMTDKQKAPGDEETARLRAQIDFRSERIRILTQYVERISKFPTPSPDQKLEAAFAMVGSLKQLKCPPGLESRITVQEGAWSLAYLKADFDTVQSLLENRNGAVSSAQNPYNKNERFLARPDINTEIGSQGSEMDLKMETLRNLERQQKQMP